MYFKKKRFKRRSFVYIPYSFRLFFFIFNTYFVMEFRNVKMAASIELKTNRTILNPNFEGYKLSLEKLPIYRAELSCGKNRMI